MTYGFQTWTMTKRNMDRLIWTQCKTSGQQVECANTELETVVGEDHKWDGRMTSRNMPAWPGSNWSKIETPGKVLERPTSANGSNRFEKKKNTKTLFNWFHWKLELFPFRLGCFSILIREWHCSQAKGWFTT